MTHFYLQPESGSSLFLVESALFTTPGTLPTGCWWQRTFGGSTRLPDPLRQQDNLPVYGVAIPAPILQEMLHGMKFQGLLVQMSGEMPASLVNVCTYSAWREYLEYYGLYFEEEESEDLEPPTKRARIETPREIFVRLATNTLAAKIKAEHPDWPMLQVGQKKAIECEFINTFNIQSINGNRRFLLDVPSDPPGQFNVAHEIGMHRKSDDADIFEDEIGKAFAPFKIYWRMATTRKSKATQNYKATKWPAVIAPTRSLSLPPGDHDVMKMAIRGDK
jgi:hypothetical protein